MTSDKSVLATIELDMKRIAHMLRADSTAGLIHAYNDLESRLNEIPEFVEIRETDPKVIRRRKISSLDVSIGNILDRLSTLAEKGKKALIAITGLITAASVLFLVLGGSLSLPR